MRSFAPILVCLVAGLSAVGAYTTNVKPRLTTDHAKTIASIIINNEIRMRRLGKSSTTPAKLNVKKGK